MLAMFLVTRVTAEVFTVTSTADSGAGSLRHAILEANATNTYDGIEFDIALNGQTIVLTSGKLTISDQLDIDASALPDGIAVSGNASSRVFDIAAGITGGY